MSPLPPPPVDSVRDDDDDDDDDVTIVTWTGAPAPGDEEDWYAGEPGEEAHEDDEDEDGFELPEGFDDLEGEDDAEQPVPMIGRVAVVGYPNVGKSTLVNRLSGSRQAIVHETPGVTRDRKEIPVEWNGERFLMIDTGGVDQGDPSVIARQIISQARAAIEEADLVVLVVDAAAGMSAADQELAEILRTERARVIVAANKVDNVRNEVNALEFHALALGDPLPVSAHHGNNTGDLLDMVVDQLREHGTRFVYGEGDDVIRIAVVGRPNVGKSTLINAMLGNERVIVSEVAGTTRDAIDTPLEFEGRELVLVDTAGLRRRKKQREAVEYYGEVRALQGLERADIALLLVDASRGLTDADIAIADKVRERQCATIVVLSKWDINDVDLADVKLTITEKLRQRPEIVTTSGVTGRNVQRLLQKVVELADKNAKRVSTGELNRYLAELKEKTPPPMDRRSRRRLNILYATQFRTKPPRIRIFVNDRGLVTRSYAYFIENRLREHFGFEGCPLVIDFMGRRK